MENTPNYNLKKPGINDYYNVENFNDNMDAVDGIVKGVSDDLDAHKAENVPHFSTLLIPEIQGKNIEVVAGAIRQDDIDKTKWNFINDAAHKSVGVVGEYATASGADITINFAKQYSKIISFLAMPDETFANACNMSVGASVGLDNAVLKLSTDKTIAGTVYYNGTDWVSLFGANQGAGEITVSYASNALTINHPYMAGNDISISIYFSGQSLTYYIPTLYTASTTLFRIRFLDPATGTYYTGDPTINMSVSVRKNNASGSRVDGTGENLPTGNIWFMGIFEV